MTDAQQRAAAKRFADLWKGKGYEKGDTAPFWISLLRDVYGLENPEQFISFEDKVLMDKTNGFMLAAQRELQVGEQCAQQEKWQIIKAHFI